MKNKFSTQLALAITLCFSQTLWASSDLSLAEYLDAANDQGISIVYSSDLVRPYFRVSFDESIPISLEDLRRALKAYKLALAETSGGYAVTPITVTQAPAATDTARRWVPVIEEIVVSSSLHAFTLNHITSGYNIDHEQLAKRPVVANDPLRVIARLPGTASNGISAKAAIRGGREDETLILFDSVRLYEPFHLNNFDSLFSAMDSRTIASVDIATGGFPVTHGDRMSAVMEITPSRPEELPHKRELSLGLYTGSYLQAGNIGKGDYLFSVRRSTIDLLGSALNTDLGKPAFADFYGTYRRPLSGEAELSFNLLMYGDDVSLNDSYDTEEADAIYGNTYGWVRLDKPLTDQIRSISTISIATIKNDRSGLVNKPGNVVGELQDDQEFRIYTLDQKFEINQKRLNWDAGITYTYLDAEYGFSSTLDIDPRFANLSNYPRPQQQQLAVTEYGSQVGVFINMQIQLTDQLFGETGLRLDAQDYLDQSSWDKQVSPRIGLLYRINPNNNLRLSWGEFAQAQGIHELDISDGLATFQGPQDSTQTIVSYEYLYDWFEFRLEAYEKRIDSPRAYFENLTEPRSLMPELQADRTRVTADSAKASGFEVSVAAAIGRHNVWANYTRARVDESVSGDRVRRSTDQKHGANLGWAVDLGKWTWAVESTYHSGWPTSALFVDTDGNVAASPRNDQRLDHYMSLDVKATRQWLFSGNQQLRLELGVTNLLNRDNPVGVDYTFEGDVLTANDSYSLPIAPVIDLYFSF